MARKEDQIGEVPGNGLARYNPGILLPIVVAAAFKSAQGFSAVALGATAALMAPMLDLPGLDSTTGRGMAVMAMGDGAMTVSHAGGSFFWVLAQFGKMEVCVVCRAMTLVQGLIAMVVAWVMSLVLL